MLCSSSAWNSRSLSLACGLAVVLLSLAFLVGDPGRWLSSDPPLGETSKASVAQRAFREEGSGPILVACAGVEGTGHHMFHDGIFDALAKAFDHVYHDQGMAVQAKKKGQHVSGYASQQDHYSTRHGDDFLTYFPDSRTNLTAIRLGSIAKDLPDLRFLLVDTPSFPSCSLDMGKTDCDTKSSWNNPDFLSMERGARRTNPAWRLRTIVMVRSWEDILASTLDRGIMPGGMPVELRYQANMLHTAMVILNSQIAALTSPWAVLEYDRMVHHPGACSQGLAKFLGLPGAIVEHAISKVMKRPSAKGPQRWNAQELRWIRETFDSEEATLLWPTIHQGRRHRAIC